MFLSSPPFFPLLCSHSVPLFFQTAAFLPASFPSVSAVSSECVPRRGKEYFWTYKCEKVSRRVESTTPRWQFRDKSCGNGDGILFIYFTVAKVLVNKCASFQAKSWTMRGFGVQPHTHCVPTRRLSAEFDFLDFLFLVMLDKRSWAQFVAVTLNIDTYWPQYFTFHLNSWCHTLQYSRRLFCFSSWLPPQKAQPPQRSNRSSPTSPITRRSHWSENDPYYCCWCLSQFTARREAPPGRCRRLHGSRQIEKKN